MYRQASLCCSWSLGLDLSLEYSSKHYLIFLSCLNWLECLSFGLGLGVKLLFQDQLGSIAELQVLAFTIRLLAIDTRKDVCLIEAHCL